MLALVGGVHLNNRVEVLTENINFYTVTNILKADGHPQGLYSGIWWLNRFPIKKYPSFIYLHCVVAEIFVIVFTAV